MKRTTTPVAGTIELAQEALLAELLRVPDVVRQRLACIMWWDLYSEGPDGSTSPGLLALVRDNFSVHAVNDEELLPWLVEFGYTLPAAIARLRTRKTYEQDPNAERKFGSRNQYISVL